MRKNYKMYSALFVAQQWASWCGVDNQWVKAMQEFGKLGGKVKWWNGYPQSASAIPLCFELYDKDGNELPCCSRLMDIRNAVKQLRK